MPKVQNFYQHASHDWSNTRSIMPQRTSAPSAPPAAMPSKPSRRHPAYATAEDEHSFASISFRGCNPKDFKIVRSVIEQAAGVRLAYTEESGGLTVRILSPDFGRRKAACTYILYRLSGDDFPFGLLSPNLCHIIKLPPHVDIRAFAARIFKENKVFLKAKEVGVLVDLTFLNAERLIYIMAVDARPQQAMRQWIIAEAAHATDKAFAELVASESADARGGSPPDSASSSASSLRQTGSGAPFWPQAAEENATDSWPALGVPGGGGGGGRRSAPPSPASDLLAAPDGDYASDTETIAGEVECYVAPAPAPAPFAPEQPLGWLPPLGKHSTIASGNVPTADAVRFDLGFAGNGIAISGFALADALKINGVPASSSVGEVEWPRVVAGASTAALSTHSPMDWAKQVGLSMTSGSAVKASLPSLSRPQPQDDKCFAEIKRRWEAPQETAVKTQKIAAVDAAVVPGGTRLLPHKLSERDAALMSMVLVGPSPDGQFMYMTM